jgi:hypothetical protein
MLSGFRTARCTAYCQLWLTAFRWRICNHSENSCHGGPDPEFGLAHTRGSRPHVCVAARAFVTRTAVAFDHRVACANRPYSGAAVVGGYAAGGVGEDRMRRGAGCALGFMPANYENRWPDIAYFFQCSLLMLAPISALFDPLSSPKPKRNSRRRLSAYRCIDHSWR